jgi:hypothetical protein
MEGVINQKSFKIKEYLIVINCCLKLHMDLCINIKIPHTISLRNKKILHSEQ